MSMKCITVEMAGGRALECTVDVYDRPGKTLPPNERTRLASDLRACAALSLHPLPDYQCIASAPDALNDKLIVTIRRTHDAAIVAFMSAVYLAIPADPDTDDAPLTVVHTGLTCIIPGLRRTGLLKPLFLRATLHLREHATEHGLWLTSLAEVPSSLGSVLQYATCVYPAPGAPPPSSTHLRIADAVSARFRGTMRIAPEAVFDRAQFMFRGSNAPGSCFRKDALDLRWRHRDEAVNAFYAGILGRNEGNEVLQVGFLDFKRLFGMFGQSQKKRISVTREASLVSILVSELPRKLSRMW